NKHNYDTQIKFHKFIKPCGHSATPKIPNILLKSNEYVKYTAKLLLLAGILLFNRLNSTIYLQFANLSLLASSIQRGVIDFFIMITC
ncbi:MAG: hypothetical protein LBP87_04815, partial [Planctomycetaceae bacterium]|nr:hypothetical protein [Planctomycetaceae bacterium]